MKNNIIKIFLFALLGTMIMGCTSSFDDVNKDPNRSSDAPITNILAYCIRYTSNNMFDPWADMNEPSTYAGHLAKIQYIDESRYVSRAGVISSNWRYTYITLNNVRDIIKRAEAEKLTNMASVGKVWEVVLMQLATDRWRDLPYTEALKIEDKIILPKYDTQETIYPLLIALLKDAAAGLSTGKDALGVGDVLYSGKTEKWLKFANSLRLRLAMRIADADPALAKKTVEEILGAPSTYPLLTSNSDNAFFKWPGTSPYYEPWYDDSRSRDDHAVSDIMINILKELDDPRLPVYAKPNKDGIFTGAEIGGPDAISSTLGKWSRVGERFRDNKEGFTPYLRAAETYFNIAEAAKRGWKTGMTTKDAYDLGVRCSMEENKVAEKDITTYLEGKGAFKNDLNQIYLQEWICLFKQGMEAWSLYRKTGIPTTHHIASSMKQCGYTGHNTPPLRYPYPVSESTLNAANSKSFAADVKDEFWGKQMWWDKRNGVN